MHSPLPPFSAWSGPRDAKCVFLGEAWGAGEEEVRKPFVGETGKEFWRMLGDALPDLEPALWHAATRMHSYGLAWHRQREEWLDATSIAFTNVLNFRPPANKVPNVSLSKKELLLLDGGHESLALGPITRSPRQLYLRPEYLGELSRLKDELVACRDAGGLNLLVAMGNTATWATLRSLSIGNIRGSVTYATLEGLRDLKVLPTFHPANVIYQWSNRPTLCQDLIKARREAKFPEIRRPRREILVNPSLAEVDAWVGKTLALTPPLLSVDSETAFGQITCISFARAKDQALVIPFVDYSKPGWSYWSDEDSEDFAWHLVRRLLESPIPKLFQNGLYDLQYIRAMRINPRACEEDTMLLHHSLFPEIRKGLGFLGSIYTDEVAWKLMNRVREKKVRRVRRGRVVSLFGAKKDG